MDLAPRTTAAFDSLIAALGEIRDSYVLAAERFTDPLDVVEGYRYVTQLLAVVSGLFCEADPLHPRFVPIVDPGRKLQGDNPDAIYHFCRISGDQGYRIRGRIDEQCYTSFTIHGAAADGGMAGPLLGDVNDRALHVGDDGRYELILSATRPAGDGDWLRLEPGAHSVIVRSYFQLDPPSSSAPRSPSTSPSNRSGRVSRPRRSTTRRSPPGSPKASPCSARRRSARRYRGRRRPCRSSPRNRTRCPCRSASGPPGCRCPGRRTSSTPAGVGTSPATRRW